MDATKRKISALAFLVAMIIVVMVVASTMTATVRGDDTGLKVTSYETVVNGVSVSNITEGTAFTLRLNLLDSRLTSITGLQAKGKMNTASFRPLDGQGMATASINSDNTYTLEFNVVYTGVGNTFECDVYYASDPAVAPTADIPVTPLSLPLNNCVETVHDSSASILSDGSSAVVRGTGFALKQASYGTGSVLAGERFTLDITMLATSGSTNIENVSATLVPEKEFTLASGTSTVYFGTAKSNQEIPLSFDMLAAADAKDGSYKVTLQMKGVNSLTGEAVETSVDLSIPIAQPDRLVINNFTPPDYISAGMEDGTGYTSVNIVNMGKSEISNVTVDIVGDEIYTLEGNTYLGTFTPGAQNTADFTVMCDEVGEFDAELIVSYENARGEANELRESFSIEVAEPSFEDMPISSFVDENAGGGLPLWGWLLIGLGVAGAAAVVIVLVVKKRRQARDEELEDDEDADL